MIWYNLGHRGRRRRPHRALEPRERVHPEGTKGEMLFRVCDPKDVLVIIIIIVIVSISILIIIMIIMFTVLLSAATVLEGTKGVPRNGGRK